MRKDWCSGGEVQGTVRAEGCFLEVGGQAGRRRQGSQDSLLKDVMSRLCQEREGAGGGTCRSRGNS